VGDHLILVVFVSILVAALFTLIFAKLRASENPREFWHGFYEAWTASIVIFAILGVAGTIVSLYRPEKDVFATKVRILCGGRIGPEVDYIREIVTKIGYYSESVVRNYTIKGWDLERRAYEIEVSHRSVNKNFFDDDALDTGSLTLKPDPLTPALDPIGRLIEVRVGDDDPVVRAENIPVSGLAKKWPVQLKKGGEARILVRHSGWYHVDIVHNFRPARFAKVVEVSVSSELPDTRIAFVADAYEREVADFRSTAPGKKIPHRGVLQPSVLFKVTKDATNCLPNELAFALKFEPPEQARAPEQAPKVLAEAAP
jgi:hypothetical protein